MSKKRKRATDSKIGKKSNRLSGKKPTPAPIDSQKQELETVSSEIVPTVDNRFKQERMDGLKPELPLKDQKKIPEQVKGQISSEEKSEPLETKPESLPEEIEKFVSSEKKDEEALKEERIEEPIGDLEISILKDIKEKNQNDYDKEFADIENIEQRFNWQKQLADKLPDSVKHYENKFQLIIEKSKKELSTEGTVNGLKIKLENRQESIDLCLKMITHLNRFFPQLETLKDNVTKVKGLNNYEWGDDNKFIDISKTEFASQQAQLLKEIESVRNHNYHVIRQKRESVEQYKKFFFDFFGRHFFSIIDGLDRGKTFFKENKSEWTKSFSDFKELIEARYLIYDSLLDITFNFLKKFHIQEIPVKEGDEFNEQIHEPFMVEEDSNMEPGKITIKEINSRGFKFNDPNKNEDMIIRPPQVIVVKK